MNLQQKGKKKALLVDDHPKLVRFIEMGLKLQGFETATAISGQQALEKAGSNELDIMLLDIRLPDMDGFEVLSRLRKFTQLPVIAYSATPEYSARALECGANAFIAKPFDMDLLVSKIRELI